MTKKFNTLDELHKQYPWRSEEKFIPLAKRYGFTESDAREYLQNKVIHDVKVPPPKYMSIFAKHPYSYQMDTFINNKSKGKLNYLIFININTRKAYAYPLHGKGADTVIEALNRFINDVGEVFSITSDQDRAYLSNKVLEFIKSKNINYFNTEDNNHNVLGIVNRFMRTIRDLAEGKYIDENEMKKIIDSYNESPHESLDNRAPNDITLNDELEYIENKCIEKNPYDFKPGDKVRVVIDKNPLSKHRSNVSKKSYIVDSKEGNQFVIRASDYSVDTYPGYKLVKSKQSIPIADTLKNGKRGIIQEITSYDKSKNKYHVVYEGGAKDFIPAKNLRESAPTKLSQMEREYWIKHSKNIPTEIRKWL